MLVGKMSNVWFGSSTTSIIFASSGDSDETQMDAFVIRTKPCVFLYTMHNEFSNCFVWVSPSTSDLKVSKGAKIRNRYNQVTHLTQDTNGKVTNSQ